MIINPPLHAAYVYDMLAIKAVKKLKQPSIQNDADYASLHDCLVKEVGEDKHFDILSSKEYMDLYCTNMDVFDAVERLKKSRISASEVDYLNWVRFLHKNRILNKFFPNTNMGEVKIGYDDWTYLPIKDNHLVVLIDAEDLDLFKGITIGIYTNRYPTCHKGEVHRAIVERRFGSIPSGMVVDHISGNVFDARKKNLRVCTSSQNSFNTFISKRNTTGYRGVVRYKNRFVAQIRMCNKAKRIGYFDTAKEAAIAYYIYTVKLYGREFTNNQPFYTEEEIANVKQKLLSNKTNGKHSSKYYGVTFYKATGKWKAEFKYKKQRYHLGYFYEERTAAEFVDRKLIELGNTKKLNFNRKEEDVISMFSNLSASITETKT